MAREEEEAEFVDEDENEDSDFAAGEDEGDAGEEDEEGAAAAEQQPKQKQRSSSKKKRGRSDDKQAKKKKKGSHFFEEEADEDDDDDDEGGGGRKRPKASRFIDDIAAVDTDEEEEEADEDADDLLADNVEDLGGEDLGVAGAAAHYRELDELRHRSSKEKTEEEWLKYVEEKYKDADMADDDEDDYEAYGEEEDVGQTGLQPTAADPGLFIVSCRHGCEREACLQLLQKAYNMQERGRALEIKSAVCMDHLRGFIYVEAAKDSHVLEAIRGLRTLFSGKGARLVPLRERGPAITVNRAAKAAIEPGSWVRVRNGLYKDDLGKVVDVDFAASRATIRLVPRLDLAAMAKEQRSGAPKRNPFGRQAVRPPARPFRAKEAGELGLPVGKDKADSAVVVLNTHRFIDGYTLRGYNLKGLILQDVAPPLAEISRFNAAGREGGDGGGADDMNDPTASLESLLRALPEGAAPRATYVKGDRVVVVAGDLNTLEGVVEAVKPDEERLVVRPDLMPDELVELELGEVQKLFKAGDHVVVLAGSRAGERGMVVRLDGPLAILLPDTAGRNGGAAELKVFVRDLSEAKGASTGVEVLGGKYALHDLVQLDAHVAGVIIGIDKDAARVLTNQSTLSRNDVRVCKEVDILRKLQANRASTTDVSGGTVSVGDYVTLLEAAPGAASGPGSVKKERGGTVHAVSRGAVFIRCQELADRGGFLVARNRQVRVRGTAAPSPAAAAAAAAAGGGPVPASVLASPVHAAGAAPVDPFAAARAAAGAGAGFSGRVDGGGRGGGFGGGGGGRHGGGSALVGQELQVRAGPYARYKGRVKQETATHLQLELDAINRIVTVKKEDVLGRPGARLPMGVGGYQPQPGGPVGAGGMGGMGYMPPGSRTPAHVMATPMHPSMGGGMTPSHPSRTPMHPSMTPMHPGMTPAHPSMTPAHPSLDGDDYYSRSRPPPPAAATPGGYNAPTPGGYNAPTPGGMGGYMPAPTPGTAETPGAYADHGNAATPGIAATPGGQDAGYHAYGGYQPAPTPGGPDGPAPTPGYYQHPTPGGGGGYGAPTPGMGLTPGMVSGYTPAGPTPGMAYTPSLDGMPGGGVPGTPGGGYLPPGDGAAFPGPPPGAAAAEPAAALPDYEGVLVKLPDGSVGVAGASRPDGSTEARPLGDDAAPPVVLDVVELVEVGRKDWVKAVMGEHWGLVGELISFDGSDAVLKSGHVVDVSMLGKLADSHIPRAGSDEQQQQQQQQQQAGGGGDATAGS